MKRSFQCLPGATVCGLSLLGLLAVAPISLHAAGGFVPLPGSQGSSPLRIRFVRYTGGASGRMVVEVRNSGQKSERFVAKGLYFVPDGDPAAAPQRLGAAGPFEDGQGQRHDELSVAPGKTERLELQVFCLDSHRSSPGGEQKFSVARGRLPKSLGAEIASGAGRILRAKGSSLDAAVPAIQSHVWQTRNKKWIKLQGERTNEKVNRPFQNDDQQQRVRFKEPMRQLAE